MPLERGVSSIGVADIQHTSLAIVDSGLKKNSSLLPSRKTTIHNLQCGEDIMAGYTGDYTHSSGSYTSKSGSLAVPTPARPGGSRKGSHASANSVDLGDGDGQYGQQSMTEIDQDLPLELDTFQAPDFNVARLVGSLTDSLITASKQGGGGVWKMNDSGSNTN